MLNEQSNILTSTEKPTTSKADPQTEAPPHPGKATPCPALHLPAIWNHRHMEDSCGFQWCDVDAVTLEFPLDTSSLRLFHSFITLLLKEYFAMSRLDFHLTKNIFSQMSGWGKCEVRVCEVVKCEVWCEVSMRGAG